MMSELKKVADAILSCYNDRLKLEKIRATESDLTPRLRNRLDAMIAELKGLELQLKKGFTDPDFIRRLEQSAIRRAKDIAEKYSQAQTSIRAKRRTYGGKTLDELSERNAEIIARYKSSKLTRSSFAKKYAAEFKLKWREVMNIIPA